jgi:hypothetical protein
MGGEIWHLRADVHPHPALPHRGGWDLVGPSPKSGAEQYCGKMRMGGISLSLSPNGLGPVSVQRVTLLPAMPASRPSARVR